MFMNASHGSGQKWKNRIRLAAIFLLAAVIFVAYAKRRGDLKGYVAAGAAVLSGADIYADVDPGLNTWPPFFSLVCVPLALTDRISPRLTAGLWMIVDYVLLWFVLSLVTRLVYGRKLTFQAQDSGMPLASAPVLVPLLLTFPYLLYHMLYHQVNLLIFLLALGGLVLQANERPLSGGIALGAAVAMKVMPIAFIPYLAYRRRWRSAAYAAAAAAAFSLSPILVFGWRRFWHYADSWLQICAHNNWGAGNANQSLYAMWDRILGHGLVPFVMRGPYELPMSHEPRVTLAWMLTLAVTTLVVLFMFRGVPTAVSTCALAEWSVVFLIAAVFGPVAWKHYLIVLLLPNALLFAAWRSRDLDSRTRRIAGAILLICFLLSVSASRDLVGKSLADRLQSGSVVTDAALIMFAGLLWFRRQMYVREFPDVHIIDPVAEPQIRSLPVS